MDLMTLTSIIRSFWVVWLMGVFFFIIFWAFRPKNKKRFEDDAMIIFRNSKKDGDQHHG